MRTHSDYRPSNCSICGQHFSSFNELFYHMRIHATTDEKPHICSICNKIFSQLNELNEHMKQHSNPKPYKCDICQKQFTQSNNLKTHIKVKIHCNSLYLRNVSNEQFIFRLTFIKTLTSVICAQDHSRSLMILLCTFVSTQVIRLY